MLCPGLPVLRSAATFGADRSTAVNVAVTALSPLIVTSHWLCPEQAPLQPANFESLSAAATSVTCVPATNDDTQVGPQSIPPAPPTYPDPVPVLLTFSVNWGGG